MDKLKKIGQETRSLRARGIPEGGFFEIEFQDGTTAREHDTNWSDISEEVVIGERTLHVCFHPVKSIRICHGKMETSIQVPKGAGVFQAICSQTVFLPNHEPDVRHMARIVGIVQDGAIVEERLLDFSSGKIIGYRK